MLLQKWPKWTKCNNTNKINILMFLNSLSYIFLKVGEHKVPLEFRFS